MSLLAAIILTKNEERDLPKCLASLAGVTSEIYVIDSGSTDRTAYIAQSYGAHVLTHEFVNHAQQLNWALQNIRSDAEWLFRIDADERVSPELAQSLAVCLPQAEDKVTGFEVACRVSFLGRPLRWGATYPVWLLRVWRRGKARCEDTWMDEHMVLDDGEVRRLKGDLIHEIPKSLSDWIRKHDWYAERECRDILGPTPTHTVLRGQARWRRLAKRQVFLRLPPFYRAGLYWLYRYVFRLGFLDGKEGLIYHFLQAFWYRFLVDAKLYEARRGSPCRNS